MHSNVAFLHKGVRPYSAHKLILFYQLPVSLHQNRENLGRLELQRYQRTIPKKEALRRVQSEGTKFPAGSFWSIHGKTC